MFGYDGGKGGELGGQFSYSYGPETACSGGLSENEVLVFDHLSDFDALDVQYAVPEQGHNFYEYTINLSSYYSPNEYLYIRLSSDDAPTESRVYTLGESTAANSPKAGEAYIAYCFDGTCLYTGKSGNKLNMTVTGDEVVFEFCDVDLFYYWSLYTTLSGVVKYKP
jgi:hypothetical protein